MPDSPQPPEQEQATAEPPSGPPPGSPHPARGGIASEVSRRVSAILDAVEDEAVRLREDAREEARHYLDYSRRRADGLVAERQRRIAELSDELMSKVEAVVGRLDDAAPVRAGFENLVRALGDAAERLSQEVEEEPSSWEPPPFYAETAAPPPPQAPPQPPAWTTQAPPAPAAYPPPPPTAAPGQPAVPHGAGGAAQSQGSEQPGLGDWRDLDEARLVAIQMASTGYTRGRVREHLHGSIDGCDGRDILDEIFGPGSGDEARAPWTGSPP